MSHQKLPKIGLLAAPESRHVKTCQASTYRKYLSIATKLRISLLEGCRAPCLPISSVAGDAVATIGQAAAVMIVVSYLDLDHLATRCCSANVSEAFPLFTYYFPSIFMISRLLPYYFPLPATMIRQQTY